MIPQTTNSVVVKNHSTDDFVSAFHFIVSFLAIDTKEENILISLNFSEVSGLGAELQTEDVVCAGENRYVYHLPKPAKTKNLVLKHAFDKQPSAIVKWADDAIYKFKFRLYDVIVELVDENDETVKVWYFCEAYPIKLSYSDLNASKNEIVIETLELAYKYTKFK